MKKKKQKPLTKDQKKIAELSSALVLAEKQFESLEYNHNRLFEESKKKEMALADADRSVTSWRRKYDLILSEVRYALRLLENVDVSLQSSSQLQRAIGVAQGQLSSVVNITSEKNGGTMSTDGMREFKVNK